MEKRCDAIVYIGGSIFIEYDNWKQILTWWDYEALNRKFYIWVQNLDHTKQKNIEINLQVFLTMYKIFALGINIHIISLVM